ncbi:uncharacterized protein AMSG_05609 [Thecamonas trahens ATCC 50062]|uniref:Uncharacterized protein n=1 Tax=Thecamonas trahens ATCC 50062 TaxID=461836 RepID=A0A0L0DE38_THETB|nr:hypothetical protein AMSG_05609 [Thecamonas trahens ATCC 50062]KNC49573.1 hypothetical protein AMSG_05609 [Thecamonas trahens ATCC 50062]|eukprot:XP_013757682.1 hypothetical protein AMSG_05609 [Thecamonas trahens ATCC 50062]
MTEPTPTAILDAALTDVDLAPFAPLLAAPATATALAVSFTAVAAADPAAAAAALSRLLLAGGTRRPGSGAEAATEAVAKARLGIEALGCGLLQGEACATAVTGFLESLAVLAEMAEATGCELQLASLVAGLELAVDAMARLALDARSPQYDAAVVALFTSRLVGSLWGASGVLPRLTRGGRSKLLATEPHLVDTLVSCAVVALARGSGGAPETHPVACAAHRGYGRCAVVRGGVARRAPDC